MYALLGFAVGTWLRLMVAAPIALLIPYLVMAFPPAMEPVWLRHLVVVSSNCCTTAETLSLRAVGGFLVLTCTVAFGAFLVSAHRYGGGLRLVHGVPAVGVGVALALVLAAGLAAVATDARRQGLRCQDASGTQLCLWPEHEQVRSEAAAILARVGADARRTGARYPRRVTESGRARPMEGVVSLEPGATASERTGELLGALTPRPSEECLQRVRLTKRVDRELYWSVTVVVAGWWAHRLGVPIDSTAATDPGQVRQWLRGLEARPMHQQVSAMNQIVTAVPGCGRLPAM
ncbi:hypothetical protein FB459_1936 [Yimella lutea]|uniref:Uncharacterized protein n=2 Tax=Yimella lutea TaxID=587872 RepID=A0A542EGK3_9MICO|nr:hypothetical protein [Yimella lutea]TQJ14472.1 hypothetical protein FB459_1936 [Yimella lutea]